MSRPASRTELLDRMDSDFADLLRRVDELDSAVREQPGACEQWSAKDLMAHLDAWHELLLGWEEQGRTGARPQMPAPGVTWAQTPELNDRIWQRTRDDDWADVRARLVDSQARVCALVASYSDEELFAKRRFAWTGSTSVGSYAVSATTSHYDWAQKLIARFTR